MSVVDSLIEKLEMLSNEDVSTKSAQNQRQIISDVLLFLEQKEGFPFEFEMGLSKNDIVNICLKRLRQLNNLSHAKKKSCKMFNLELDRLLDEICLCGNILLSDSNVKINFSFDSQKAVCSPSLIVDAFLNLISNAVKFSDENEVFASMTSADSQIIISVANSLKNPSAFNFKGGLECVKNICTLHKGRLLFFLNKNKLTSSIAISKNMFSGEDYIPPSFSQYLSDKYSAVYVGLSELTDKKL